MNQKSLSSLLRKFESPAWCDRTVDGTDELVRWIPLFSINSHNFGLTDQGYWAGEFSDNIRIRPESFYVAFFVILEESQISFIETLKNSINRSGLPEAVIRTFPFDKVLEYALEASPEWHSKAYEWLKAGYPISPRMALQMPDDKLIVKWQQKRIDEIVYA